MGSLVGALLVPGWGSVGAGSVCGLVGLGSILLEDFTCKVVVI